MLMRLLARLWAFPSDAAAFLKGLDRPPSPEDSAALDEFEDRGGIW